MMRPTALGLGLALAFPFMLILALELTEVATRWAEAGPGLGADYRL